jgi:tetratricopeptide (TPR) repeat protein
VKPIDPHQDDLERDGDRFAAIVATEARGEPLTAADADFRRRYQDACPDAAAEAELWSGIGALGGPRAGSAGMTDADLLARVLRQAGAAPPARTSVRRRGIAVTFAAVALAATLMVAFAAELRDRLVRSTVIPPVATASSNEAAPPPLPNPPRDEAPALAPAPAPPPAPPPAVHAAPPSEARAPSADELLRRAQDHLGAGRATEAAQTYRELVARYPASAEGRAALISLGRLALDEGRADEALGHLDRYLLSGGPLAEEARYWRIEALRRLGRSVAEAAAIDELLGLHPASVHAERLRARVEVLRGGEAQVPSVATTPK